MAKAALVWRMPVLGAAWLGVASRHAHGHHCPVCPRCRRPLRAGPHRAARPARRRRPDRHRVCRDLPQRHPHGPGRVGCCPLPDRHRARDRRDGQRGGGGRDGNRRGRPGWGGLPGRQLRRVRPLQGRPGDVLHQACGRDVQLAGLPRGVDRRGLQPADRRHRADGGPDPRRALARRRGAAALRGDHDLLAAEALGRRAGRQGRRRRGGRPRAHGREDRRGTRRPGHDDLPDRRQGGRRNGSGGDEPPRDQRPRRGGGRARVVRPHPQHRQRPLDM